MSSSSRRSILKTGGFLSLGLLSAGIARAAEVCGLTPPQTEGPFYPVNEQTDKDVDLTRIEGHSQAATGQIIRIVGQVRDMSCKPLAGAMVEIWQACASGKYNHPEDPNTAALDPHFQYWGRTTTDANGHYSFLSIKPGAYPATSDWIRPPHIHYKVAAPGHRTLTTQFYFEGDPHNAKDRILRALPPAQRKLVIAPFAATVQNPNVLAGTFDVVIGKVGAVGATPELD